jgi:hypothetical protein
MDNQKVRPRRKTALRFGAVIGAAALTTFGIATPSYAATPDTDLTQSTLVGPTGGGNTLTLTTAGSNNQYVAGSVFVEFQWDSNGSQACSTAYTATTPVHVASNATDAGVIAATDVRVVSPTRLAVAVPGTLVLGVGNNNATERYSVCVYNSNNPSDPNSLITKTSAATTNYTIGAIPVITSVSPAAGPAQGGNWVTITGTGFSASGMTASIAGMALTSVSSTTTSLTGQVPAHGPGGPYAVSVQLAAGGNAIKKNGYTYGNAVNVTPNTAPSAKTTPTDVSVTGTGFFGLTFGTTGGQTPDDPNAHVYLVRGIYDPARTTSGTKANGQTVECQNVLVVSDTELVCSLFLAGNGIAQASQHNVTGTTSGNTLTATVGSFNQGDVGMAVTGSTNLGTGNYIASVTDATHAVLAKTPTSAITSATALSVAPNRTFADATLTNGSNIITSTANAQFTSSDVGRAITGTNIAGGTTITAVNSATSAVLSANAGGTASGTYTISYAPAPVAVPVGAYTITVVSNGNIDAQPGGTKADPNYYRTAMNSGSSFTVADF